jgi:chromosome segregation ATPase
MGLGGTAKKLQKVTDMADDVYTRLNDLRDQIVEMRETTQETSDRVDRLERETAEVRALVEALAEKEGIDIEGVTAEAHIHEAEREDGDAASESQDADLESQGAERDGSDGDSADHN